MAIICLKASEELKMRLQNMAKELGVSVSDIIRESVSERLAMWEAEQYGNVRVEVKGGRVRFRKCVSPDEFVELLGARVRRSFMINGDTKVFVLEGSLSRDARLEVLRSDAVYVFPYLLTSSKSVCFDADD